jgi:hypothetical protein
MTRRQSHRKPTNRWCWRPAIAFAVAYALVVGVTAVALAYVGVIFSERATTAVRHLPAVLASLATLIGMVSQILTSPTTAAGHQGSVSSRSASRKKEPTEVPVSPSRNCRWNQLSTARDYARLACAGRHFYTSRANHRRRRPRCYTCHSTGAQVTSLRDSSATRVAVKANSCCRRFSAYDYQGDGNDHMLANSINWIDDHNLLIRYSVDLSGVQVCRTQVGDIKVICEAQPAPTFDNNIPTQPV